MRRPIFRMSWPGFPETSAAARGGRLAATRDAAGFMQAGHDAARGAIAAVLENIAGAIGRLAGGDWNIGHGARARQ